MAKKEEKVEKKEQTAEELYKFYTTKYPTAVLRTIKSGSIVLDYVFGGGFPLGKVILFTAQPGLGKTLVSLALSGRILSDEKEGIVLYIDAETGVVDELVMNVHGESFGERFVRVSPHSYEATQEIVQKYAKTGKLLAVFIDSVTALYPASVLEDDMKNPIGAKAAGEAMFTMRMKIFASLYHFGVVYINQQRAYINMTPGKSGGPSTKPAGGWSLKYYNDMDLQMWPAKFLYDASGNKVGVLAKVLCEKNRMVGNRSGYLYLKYGFGISNVATVVSILREQGFVKQGGAVFTTEMPELFETPLKLKGNVGIEEFVTENFEKLYAYLNKSGAVGEYFKNFKPS